jgi:phosphatidate cytidylyltransferase
MLRQRVITAVVLVLVLIGALAAGPLAFAAFAAVAFGAAVFEWMRLAGWTTPLALGAGIAVAAVLLALESLHVRLARTPLVVLAGASCAAWLFVAGRLVVAERRRDLTLNPAAVVGIAPVLLGGAWFSLLALFRQGALFLFSTLAIVWIADIAAYFSGRAFGRRKLSPAISPGKTWAGVAGALIAVLIAAAAVWMAWPDAALFSNALFARAPLGALLMLALVVVLSIVGDLFESLLKRHAGVKDSSGLLPGHGGVLDRIDALLPVLPAAILIEALL